jgi:hypothetical protein
MRLNYNAQLNTKAHIFKIYTPWEFYLGMCSAFIPVVIPLAVGIDPTFLDCLIVFCIYSIMLLYFKVGKPEGYLEHLLRHLITPTEFRPGHKLPVYPIKPDDDAAFCKAVKRTPEELWDAAGKNQDFMARSNITCERLSSNKYILLDPEETALIRSYIAEGGVIGVGYSKDQLNKNAKQQ